MYKSYLKANSRVLWLVIALLVLATLACGPVTAPTATPIPPTETPIPPKPTPVPPTEVPATESVGTGGASLDIVNQSQTPVCYLYISPTKSSDWGADQLGQQNVINPGNSFTITGITAGTYDLQAQDCSGYLLGVIYSVDLTEGGEYTWTINTITLTIINESTSIACRVFIALPNATDWGTSWTPEGTQIMPGQSYQVTGVPAGVYALRVETCSGNYNWTWETFDMTADAVARLGN